MKKLFAILLTVTLCGCIKTSISSTSTTLPECTLSLCDCQCYVDGTTPEQVNGVLCGINCLGEYGVSGCELRNNECFVVKENTQLANPASVKCVEDGGTVKILTESEGQRGICLFSDGSVCDEWAYFRGECSQGDCMKKCGAIGTRSEGWYDCNGNLLYWDNCASQEFDCTPYAGSNACTMDYNPVCAEIQADGGNFFETFGNLCGACTSGNNIVSLRRGECPEDALMRESTPV